MNAPIFNRQFQHPDDGRYQIEAFGYHPVKAGGDDIVQVIDDKAIQSIADNFNRDASRGALRSGSEMLVDHEHFKHDSSQETTAYGWMTLAEPRIHDGVYADIRWTGTGQKAVDGGDYRFFSTEYDPADMEAVAPADVPQAIRAQYPGYKFLRPLKLDGLSLTNMNNNLGQKPITNRARPGTATPAPSADKKAADLIMNRAMELRRAAPGLSLASAIIIAQRDPVASSVHNRAAEIRKATPGLTLAGSYLATQRQTTSSVLNRASQMRAANPSLSLAASARLAIQEKSHPVANRAAEIRQAMPGVSLATSFIMAQREFGGLDAVLNRDDSMPSDADWQAACDKADDVLAFLQTDDEKSTDPGNSPQFKQLPPNHKFWTFKKQIDRLAINEGLSTADAFQKLKDTQPEFWAQSILDFDPAKYAC